MLGYLGLSRKQDILQFILRLMEELQILLSLLQHQTLLMQVERLAIIYNNFNGDKKNAYTYFSYHLLLLLFYIRKTKIFNQYN